MNKKTTTTIAKIMQYKKSLTTSIIAITLAMMFTATIPVQQQEAYAEHVCPPDRPIEVHIDGVSYRCLTPEELEEACSGFQAPFDECQPIEEPPLEERFLDQGSCITEANTNPNAGFTKEDCKTAFKQKSK